MHDKQSGSVSEHRSRDENEKGKEIDLKALYATLSKKLWLIALITITITVLAGMYNARPEMPLYSASARVIIGADTQTMGTARVFFREPLVLEKVIEQLGLERSISTLRGQIRLDSAEGSLISIVSVVDPDPAMAANIANTSVEVYREAARDTIGVGIRLLTPAEEIPFPINEKSNTIVYAAFILSLALGVGLVFLLDSLNDSIRSEREIEKLLGLTALGQVSKMRRKDYTRKSKQTKSVVARGETIGS